MCDNVCVENSISNKFSTSTSANSDQKNTIYFSSNLYQVPFTCNPQMQFLESNRNLSSLISKESADVKIQR